ncbi:hypothetical protein EV379_1203 [Microterricola gilva]|uniref:Uncharacterized protein n=1 Tax=Microterricola gilva TaxID=393267 RepID=A0A4Q8AK63_9MICO|nr:DNA-binding protein [Microterricola gilva]RZU64892.1 hypothetical protein EV379_1203 [Microterricola gilva]
MTAETVVEPMLPISVVAKTLDVGRHYVQNRIDAGELAVVELGTNLRSKKRIPASSLAAFIKARTFGGAAS